MLGTTSAVSAPSAVTRAPSCRRSFPIFRKLFAVFISHFSYGMTSFDAALEICPCESGVVGSLADRLVDSLPQCEHVSSLVLPVCSCCSLWYGCHDKDRRRLSPGTGPRVLAMIAIHCYQHHGLDLPTCSLSASQSAEHLHDTGWEARATTSRWSALQATPKSFGACEAEVRVSLGPWHLSSTSPPVRANDFFGFRCSANWATSATENKISVSDVSKIARASDEEP